MPPPRDAWAWLLAGRPEQRVSVSPASGWKETTRAGAGKTTGGGCAPTVTVVRFLVRDATVILRRCASYDVDRIRGIVREGLQALGDLPRGRVLLKPNGVIAHRRYFPYAYTRPEFIDGVLGATRDVAPDLEELAVGERCGITIPTRMVFREAGWLSVIKRHRAKVYYFEEEPQVEVKITREPRLRDTLYTARPVVRADYLVNVPKFKAHPWTTVTFALKNFIGIQHDPDRLIDHDYRLDEKIADLQEIVRQRFIAIDAIVAGQDRMLTPVPFNLGLIIMGNNPVAVDATCCRILGLDPSEIGHIRAAHVKGFGPLDASAIGLDGDVTLEQAQGHAREFRVGLVRVEDYFKSSRITAHAGPPPDEAAGDYCWGGCPGAIQEAIEIVRKVDELADEKMNPLTVVFGGYRGPIETKPGEKVVFIGDCARWRGRLDGRAVKIESLYRDRSHHDLYYARAQGLFTKMAKVYWNLFRRRQQCVMRAPGCPVSVAENTLLLACLGGTRNPYFVRANAVPFLRAYAASMLVRFFKRLLGMPRRMRAALPAPASPQAKT